MERFSKRLQICAQRGRLVLVVVVAAMVKLSLILSRPMVFEFSKELDREVSENNVATGD